jgi:hypothetical protein
LYEIIIINDNINRKGEEEDEEDGVSCEEIDVVGKGSLVNYKKRGGKIKNQFNLRNGLMKTSNKNQRKLTLNNNINNIYEGSLLYRVFICLLSILNTNNINTIRSLIVCELSSLLSALLPSFSSLSSSSSSSSLSLSLSNNILELFLPGLVKDLV